ncbi:ribose 5-phosphate isomerase [Agrilactobacillus composti DSM 18527 = JCM 14202]|uniref:ribose-5-phosphate isomerase n=1 Tax=Agrilactobacillus composti DSM 18527 = JCM 14202 TaxID=1423734 RepID=X0PD10_9LACO|nr:ribose-5-phosphate isomerase A [Agrilactobacillus composti]KRM34895.1 ribose 5-phosphate isomerase [Agrilactobacillus composti DSM 18527 = JCM 14202]GAF38769.1 ribose 5-phosphate isomerase A [Agrilactobacillus composti DSM 18527 = JCM 14202]
MDATLQGAIALLHPGMTVSLGGGSHVLQVADYLANHPELALTLCTPSELTRAYCQDLGLKMSDFTTKIDVGFDGCDSVDANLNVLKSNGGIHTSEKLYAQATANYVILTNAAKVTAILNPAFPLCLEVVGEAVPQVRDFAQSLGLRVERRQASNIMGYTRTKYGNQLLDCFAKDWAEIHRINTELSGYNGVVGTSYFAGLVNTVLATASDGTLQTYRKEVQ